MKDCHAVISVMRVSQYILNDVERTAAISRNGIYGYLRGYKKVKGYSFLLEAGLEMGLFHFCWKQFQVFFSLFLTFFLLMGGSFLYLENKCYWFVNINALPFLIRKEEFYGSKILHSCSFCKLKWIFNKTFFTIQSFCFISEFY